MRLRSCLANPGTRDVQLTQTSNKQSKHAHRVRAGHRHKKSCRSSEHSTTEKHCLQGNPSNPPTPAGSQLCYFWSCADASMGCKHTEWNTAFRFLPYSNKLLKMNALLSDSLSHISFLSKIVPKWQCYKHSQSCFSEVKLTPERKLTFQKQ